jgi:hypothetical protein
MKRWLTCLLGCLFVALLAAPVNCRAAVSEGGNRGLEARLVSSWLGVVDGEVETRTLNILALRRGPADTMAADAGYGITGGDLLPVRCTVSTEAEKTRLFMKSFYGDSIDAFEVADGWFIGTYTYKDGREASITMGRIWPEALLKNRYTITGDARITLVYFGAEDCPESAEWEQEQQPVFLASRDRGYVDFRIMKRKIHNRGPTLDDFPDDLKWLYEDAEAGGVSPYFVVAVDRTVVLRTYGYGNWERKVTPLLKELCNRKRIALAHPLDE